MKGFLGNLVSGGGDEELKRENKQLKEQYDLLNNENKILKDCYFENQTENYGGKYFGKFLKGMKTAIFEDKATLSLKSVEDFKLFLYENMFINDSINNYDVDYLNQLVIPEDNWNDSKKLLEFKQKILQRNYNSLLENVYNCNKINEFWQNVKANTKPELEYDFDNLNFDDWKNEITVKANNMHLDTSIKVNSCIVENAKQKNTELNNLNNNIDDDEDADDNYQVVSPIKTENTVKKAVLENRQNANSGNDRYSAVHSKNSNSNIQLVKDIKNENILTQNKFAVGDNLEDNNSKNKNEVPELKVIKATNTFKPIAKEQLNKKNIDLLLDDNLLDVSLSNSLLDNKNIKTSDVIKNKSKEKAIETRHIKNDSTIISKNNSDNVKDKSITTLNNNVENNKEINKKEKSGSNNNKVPNKTPVFNGKQ